VKKQINNQRGAAHLVLVLAFVVALVGVLGFLGYGAWQKQNANAGGADTIGFKKPVGDGHVARYIECKLLSISPAPKPGITSKYKVKLSAVNVASTVKFSVNPNSYPNGGSAGGKPVIKSAQLNDSSKVIEFRYKTPVKFKAVTVTGSAQAGKVYKTDLLNLGAGWSGTVNDSRVDSCVKTFSFS
jgi:hypothetical protein